MSKESYSARNPGLGKETLPFLSNQNPDRALGRSGREERIGRESRDLYALVEVSLRELTENGVLICLRARYLNTKEL